MTSALPALIDPAGIAAAADAALQARRLETLREQRARLRDLRDEVVTAGQRIPDEDLGGTWRSPAQRGYAERRAELLQLVALAGRSLDDAIGALTIEMGRLS